MIMHTLEAGTWRDNSPLSLRKQSNTQKAIACYCLGHVLVKALAYLSGNTAMISSMGWVRGRPDLTLMQIILSMQIIPWLLKFSIVAEAALRPNSFHAYTLRTWWAVDFQTCAP